MVALEPRAPGDIPLPWIFHVLVHQATASALHHHLAVQISVRIGVEAGLLPPTGARVFGGRSHVPIQSL